MTPYSLSPFPKGDGGRRQGVPRPHFYSHFRKKTLAISANIDYNIPVDRYAPLAQLVEHLTLNQGVQGSSP